MRYTELTHRTGLGRGRAYNGSGQDITDNSGAGNDMVGTFCLDFASLMPKADENGVAGYADQLLDQDTTVDLDGELVFYKDAQYGNMTDVTLLDNEYTFVIADGRSLDGDTDEDDPADLFEGADPQQDDGAVALEDTRWLSIDSIRATIMLACPSPHLAWVYWTDLDTGEIDTGNSILAAGRPDTLYNVLDHLNFSGNENAAQADMEELTLGWPHLRWTLHWSLMVVQCAAVEDEGLADWSEENQSDLPIPTNPVPSAGPHGILLAYGGGTEHTTRLWMPGETGAVRHVQRGQLILSYAQMYATQVPRGDQVIDVDVIDMDIGVDDSLQLEPTAAAVHGKNIMLRLNLKRNIKVRDNEMVLLTVQTGRARLCKDQEQPPVAGNPAETADWIIAGPPLVQGRNGPIVPLLHYEVHVTGSRGD